VRSGAPRTRECRRDCWSGYSENCASVNIRLIARTTREGARKAKQNSKNAVGRRVSESTELTVLRLSLSHTHFHSFIFSRRDRCSICKQNELDLKIGAERRLNCADNQNMPHETPTSHPLSRPSHHVEPEVAAKCK
jgi:hypothetical protein